MLSFRFAFFRVTTMLVLALVLGPRLARADTDARGVAVVAAGSATDATWPLARAVYASALLRPKKVDDRYARVLAGEASPTQFGELGELAELRAGVKGDDAASRQVLSAIADKLGVASILVVFTGDTAQAPPTARVFDATSKTFDAARYTPDAQSTWDGTIRAIERPLLPTVLVSQAAQAPVEPLAPPEHKAKSKAFFESPWFWVAVGAAVLLVGGGVLIATNVQTADTIHMQLKLP